MPTVPTSSECEFRAPLDSQLHGVSYEEKEVRKQRRDGTLIDVSLWTASLRDQHGHICGKLAISTNITERRRTEQEHLELLAGRQEKQKLQQAMDRLRDLLEIARDAIIEVDPEGKILLLNAVAEQLLGYSRQELLGR